MPPEADTIEKPDATAAAAAAAKDAAADKGTEAGKATAVAADKGKDAAADAAAAGKTVDAVKDGKTADATAAAAAAGDADADDGDDPFEIDDEAEPKDDAAKAAEADKAKADGAWRDEFLRAEEARLLGRAKTDEAKAEIKGILERRKAQLARYTSLDAALAAGLAAQDKVRAGVKIGLPENATDEEKAAYFEANGIPKEPAKYDIPNIAGHKWTEADTPRLASFKEAAHKLMLPQSAVNSLVEWQIREAQAAVEAREDQIAAIDQGDKRVSIETLRESFGREFTPRTELVKRLLQDSSLFPDEVGRMLVDARVDDGHRPYYNPGIFAGLSEIALRLYGDGALETGDQQAAAASEENELKALMASDVQAFHGKPWKSTGKTGWQRLYEINAKKAAKGKRPSAAA